MSRELIILCLLASVNSHLRAVEVTLEYEATAATVVNMPFGVDVPRETIVTGRFTYDTEAGVDSNPLPSVPSMT